MPLMSLSAIYALIPLIIIIILIAAAAGLSRGADLFSLLGFGALIGIARGTGVGGAGRGLGRTPPYRPSVKKVSDLATKVRKGTEGLAKGAREMKKKGQTERLDAFSKSTTGKTFQDRVSQVQRRLASFKGKPELSGKEKRIVERRVRMAVEGQMSRQGLGPTVGRAVKVKNALSSWRVAGSAGAVGGGVVGFLLAGPVGIPIGIGVGGLAGKRVGTVAGTWVEAGAGLRTGVKDNWNDITAGIKRASQIASTPYPPGEGKESLWKSYSSAYKDYFKGRKYRK